MLGGMAVHTPVRGIGVTAVLLPLLLSARASAGPNLAISEVKVDPPTLHALGVQMLITDDDDRDATVTVRYRKQGDSAWRDGLPLFRVHPDEVSVTIPQQFAGSVKQQLPQLAILRLSLAISRELHRKTVASPHPSHEP